MSTPEVTVAGARRAMELAEASYLRGDLCHCVPPYTDTRAPHEVGRRSRCLIAAAQDTLVKAEQEALRAEADAVTQIARQSLAFGLVTRATYHEDGVTKESDTTHTVMLGLIACAFAAAHPELGLDVGLVAQYALVHDLPEAYAGDTSTLRALDPDAAQAKEDRERAAAERIAAETSALPWLATMIEVYEARQVPEARYVKAMDKVLPKLTHILNGGVSIHEGGMSIEDVAARYVEQDEEIRKYAADFPAIFDLRHELIGDLLARLRETECRQCERTDARCKAMACGERQDDRHTRWWCDYGCCSRSCTVDYYGPEALDD